MDGLGRAIGAGSSVTLGESTYLMSPLTLGMIGTIENHLVAERVYSIDRIAELGRMMNDADLINAQMERAKRDLRKDRTSRIVTVGDLQDYLGEMSGVFFSAWLCLRPNHPRLFETLEDAQAIVTEASNEQIANFVRHRDIASGLHLISNLDWPEARSGRRNDDPFLKKKYRPIPWKSIFRKLAEARNFSKHEIYDLTLYEFNVHTADEADLGGIRRFDVEDGLPHATKQKIVHIGKDGKGLKEWQYYQELGRRRREALARENGGE